MNTPLIRIYITGMNGAGKGTVGNYLHEKHNFRISTVRHFLETDAAPKLGLSLNKRPDLGTLADSLRDKYGAGYIIQFITEQISDEKRVVIDSIRCTGEVDYVESERVRQSDAVVVLIAVDADPKIRHKRVTEQRKSLTDHVSFETFLAEEEAESIGTIPTRMNLPACVKRADILLTNDTSLEALYEQIEEKVVPLFNKTEVSA
jgi:dephospho-CoA kinase